jgi:hypothetical protein
MAAGYMVTALAADDEGVQQVRALFRAAGPGQTAD